MYSGLLPRDLTEDDLSPDEEEQQHDEEKQSAGHVSGVAENRGSLDDGKSSQTGNEAGNDSQTGCMPGTSREMWQKFQELRKKKDEIKTVKIHEKRKRRRRKGRKCEEPAENKEQQGEREQHWKELKQYFGVNDRFQPPACSKPPPKSGLEKSIEEAIAEGDVAKAEEMSDRLATREMAVQIAQAADCRDFVRSKQEEEAVRAAKKRKKQIAWGFEAKQRWETKSNMGFM
ncbi:protein FAM204A [Fundulus heteroclitus]|uniref:protein FAM204A n=1 Tax=Fundulus heteroclitus TaxID=8078 RepID=UPI00165AB373|nr:protein FAM204A [Fundulus heteroclitus]XP_035982386.1 protein FAM204A [Fundulus heteroclitus]